MERPSRTPPRLPGTRPGLRGVLTIAALLATAAVVARADIDAEVLPGDRVSASLTPASETETYRLSLPGGARLTATAKGTRKGPAVHAEVRAPGGGGTTPGTDRGQASGVSRLAIGVSGEWAVAVTSRDGVTPGDYTLRTKVSYARTASFEAPDVAGGGEATAGFSAAAGSVARLTAKVVGSPGVRASLVRLEGPDGFSQTLFATPSQGGIRLPSTGDYVLTVSHDGRDPALLSGRVTITPPRLRPRRLDLTSATIGDGAGGDADTAIAEVVTEAGGSVAVGDLGLGGGLDDISGAGVAIPSGALAFPTSIVIATAPELSVPGSGGGLGATVFFGPEGLTFGTKSAPVAVTITIPVDLAGVGNDRELVDVYVRDAKGRVTLVPGPYDFDSAPGYVSFPSTHFSSYRAVAASQGALNPFTVATQEGLTRLAPATLALGASFRALLTDNSTNTIRVLVDQGATAPTLDFFAGGGTLTADGTDRLLFDFQEAPTAVFADASGVVFVGTATRLFRISASGSVTRIAGTGVAGDGGDNGPATAAQFSACSAIVADAAGSVFFADPVNGRVRLIQSVSSQIVTEFGTGTVAFGADGPPASSTTLLNPTALAFRPGGGLYVGDSARIRALNRGDGTNVTVAGAPDGNVGLNDHPTDATAARFLAIASIFHDAANDAIFVADTFGHTIRRVTLTPTSSVTTVIGVPGTQGSSADGAMAPFSILSPAGAIPARPGEILFLERDGRLRVFAIP